MTDVRAADLQQHAGAFAQNGRATLERIERSLERVRDPVLVQAAPREIRRARDVPREEAASTASP